MTIGLAWVGTRRDGRQHLYFASDSRLRGGFYVDACPKILTLARSDCALCFAGEAGTAYPLMLHMSNAIAAHQPARERSMDISKLKSHLLRVSTDFVSRVKDSAAPMRARDAQFLFGGYSWEAKRFRIWTFDYTETAKKFAAREAVSFGTRLEQVAFIGDKSVQMRSEIARLEATGSDPIYLEPLSVLAQVLSDPQGHDTIGGAPQVVRITEHMNTRTLCVRWNGEVTLFGRPLFDYENTDYWTVDPFTGHLEKPRKFGNRAAQAGEPPLTADD